MSEQEVIEWRARALFKKFWEQLPSNPNWVRQLLQADPRLLELMIEAIIGDNGPAKLQDLRQRFRGVAQNEALDRAADQVKEGSFTIDRIADTLENQ